MHRFNITIPEDVDINKSLSQVKNNCDSFNGNEESGSFSKSGVRGTYDISGNTVRITLTDKPFLASWDYVESKIRSYF